MIPIWRAQIVMDLSLLVPARRILDQEQQHDPGHAHHKLPPLE